MQKRPWYFNTSFMVIVFLMAGPLVLPLIWFSPYMTRGKKLAASVLVIALTIVLTIMTAKSIKTIIEYYGVIFPK